MSFPALTYGGSLTVVDNRELPACAVEELFARLPNFDCYQEGNDEQTICD